MDIVPIAMKFFSFIVFFIVFVQGAKTVDEYKEGEKVLSRKKRYLIFPEGSSLQLVYCLTMPITGKSTIFTIGGTAALAWELPHDPFEPYRKPAEILHRIDTKKKGQIFLKPANYFKNKPPSINLSPSYNYHEFITKSPVRLINLGQFTKFKQQRVKDYSIPQFIDSSWNYPDYQPIYHQVHRRTRRDLYKKIEKFINAQNRHGKSCVLKAVCESSKRNDQKGSFMEEIFKAIFKVKPFDYHPNEDEYDLAADPSHNCTETYPKCDSSITQFIM